MKRQWTGRRAREHKIVAGLREAVAYARARTSAERAVIGEITGYLVKLSLFIPIDPSPADALELKVSKPKPVKRPAKAGKARK
ncbi:MAG: hypothetical protein ACREDG_00155 [Methylocella sp.]